MNNDIKIINKKLLIHELELVKLRKNYLILFEHYTRAIALLKELITSANEANKRALQASEKAKIAIERCAQAAKQASLHPVITAVDAAAKAAILSVDTALEATAKTVMMASAASFSTRDIQGC